MRQFNREHDVLLWYSRGRTWIFNRDAVRIPHKRLNTNRAGAMIANPLTPEERDAYLEKRKIPETWWPEFSTVGRLKKERTGYPTQKPLALLDRIIKASSNDGDMVLDPFCGCATACIAASRAQRPDCVYRRSGDRPMTTRRITPAGRAIEPRSTRSGKHRPGQAGDPSADGHASVHFRSRRARKRPLPVAHQSTDQEALLQRAP